MRLFIAIEIAPDIRERIAHFVERFKPEIRNARWVQPEGMHITLKFLGNVWDEKVAAIENVLRGIDCSKFALSLQDVGVFPNPRSPRVLWVGISAGPELANLANQVDTAMTRLGFEAEKRAFTPHVTLARFNDRGGKANVSAVLSGSKPSFGTMTANEFHLYESKLSPKGARYSQIKSFALH